MNEEEDKVEQSLMINPLNVPEEKFTADGKSYYYTRGDGTPITDDNWSLKDLAYPLNVPFGGKKQGNLGDWAFTNWLLNTAPSQIAPIGAGIKGIKTIRKQYRQSPHGFYKEGSIDAKPNYEDIVNDIIFNKAPKPVEIPKYSSGAVVQTKDGPLYRPEAGTMQSTFMTTTGGSDDNQFPMPDPNQPIFKGRFQNVNELDRGISALVQNRKGVPRGGGFMKFVRQSAEDLKGVYKALEKGELNAHHSNILKSGISLHENRDEYESMVIEGWLVEDSVYSGDNPLNNHLIPEQVNGLTHKWLNERIGKEYLTKLIGPVGSPLRRRWEQLPIDHPDVKSVVKQYAAYVNGASERTAELMRAYYQIWGPESPLTEKHLDLIYKELDINELQYNQLIKPGLSKKDARAYNRTYGPDKIKITWADGTNESIHRKLLQELNEDPVLVDKIERLNAQITGEEVTPYQGNQTQRQIWEAELNELKKDLKTFNRQKDPTFPEGSEYQNAKARIEALKELIHGKQLSLFRIQNIISDVFDKREANPNATRHGGWLYKK